MVARSLVFFAALVVALSVSGCKKKEESGLRGSGVGAKVVRTLPPFTSVRVGGSLRAEISVGKPVSLELRGDDNLLSHVKPRVEDGTLVLEPDQVLRTTQPLVARFGAEKLDGVALVAAASANVEGVRAEHFAVKGTGGTRLVAKGSSQTLEVNVKSAARFDLSGFAAGAAKVTAKDAASVNLGYLERLDATLTGMSRVVFRGDPVIKQDVKRPARLLRVP